MGSLTSHLRGFGSPNGRFEGCAIRLHPGSPRKASGRRSFSSIIGEGEPVPASKTLFAQLPLAATACEPTAPRTTENGDFAHQKATDMAIGDTVQQLDILSDGQSRNKSVKSDIRRQHAKTLSHSPTPTRITESPECDPGLEAAKVFKAQRIHVLGAGPYGKFIAHCLAGLANAPPISLILDHAGSIQNWKDEGKALNVVRRGKIISASGVEVELAHSLTSDGESTKTETITGIIDHLIVTTEGLKTVSVLSTLKDRLRPTSVICFLRDGLGVVEEVNSRIFPNHLGRPSYILGNITHDLRSTDKEYTIIEKYAGDAQLTMVPRITSISDKISTNSTDGSIVRRMDYGWTRGPRYLMRTITRSHTLNASGELLERYLASELQRLVTNSVIWPLSTVLNTPPRLLLHNNHAKIMMKDLLEELSFVIRSLPELSKMPRREKTFGADRLMNVIQSSIAKTHGKGMVIPRLVKTRLRSNIDFWNGYFLRRATQLGIDNPKNEHLIRLVKTKAAVKGFEMDLHIPFGWGKT